MKYKLPTDIGSLLALNARIRAVAGVVTLFAAVIILSFVGISALRDKHTLPVITTVENAQCKPPVGGQSSCFVTLEYVVNSKTYQHNTTVLVSSEYTRGDNLTVYVDPKNPDDLQIAPPSRMLGWSLLVFAFLFAIVFGLNFYALFTSKAYAEVVGGIEVARSIL